MVRSDRGPDTGEYARERAARLIENYLGGQVDRAALRAWVDAYNWDEDRDYDPLLRETLAQIELVLHEQEDGESDEGGAHADLERARARLLQPA